MFGTWSLWATNTCCTSTDDACLEFKISDYGYIAALPPINAYLHLVIEILGHRNVTKLQLIMHAWYLEFWTMYKNFTFPITINVWFSKIWATHASPQGLTRLISTNTCYFSSALLPWNTNPLGSKGVTILICIGSQIMQDSGALIPAYTSG